MKAPSKKPETGALKINTTPPPGTPACFGSREQFVSWWEAAAAETPGTSLWCRDCRPAYQHRMIAEKRCEFPGTTFKEVDEGEDWDGERDQEGKHAAHAMPGIWRERRRKKTKNRRLQR